MSIEKVDANIRLFTPGQGGFERAPGRDFRGVLRSGHSLAFGRLVSGQLEIGAEAETSWELIASLDNLSPEEFEAVLNGGRPSIAAQNQFDAFVENERILLTDGFAIVGDGTIRRRYSSENEANAV